MRLISEEDELRDRMIEREEYYARQKYLEERAKRADEAEAELKTSKAELKASKAELKTSKAELVKYRERFGVLD